MAVDRTATYTSENDEFSLDARPQQTTSTSSAIASGWAAADVQQATYAEEFKFSEGSFQVVKFLDEDGPFAVYRQHFLTQKTEGKKSYISLGPNDPLCTKLGSKPEEKRAFSVLNLSAPGGPARQILVATPRLYKSLHAAHFSPQGPLPKNYWALSRSGKMQTTTYHINPVKSRDLMEDWNIDEATAEAAVADAVPFTRADLKEPTWEELETIANSLMGL